MTWQLKILVEKLVKYLRIASKRTDYRFKLLVGTQIIDYICIEIKWLSGLFKKKTHYFDWLKWRLGIWSSDLKKKKKMWKTGLIPERRIVRRRMEWNDEENVEAAIFNFRTSNSLKSTKKKWERSCINFLLM